ncbi:SIR2 family NAD-dependent protein deacylase [Nocardioides marmoribigeumensis]|uniref:protein acetyllysine N-acetyltransferase n=1 Tax=Nocardioides marmoribigeumensis TaxID=433649 RepID=A0ABU2BTL2_9ACTN|nr:Sir2 family NAD-dependent protein deacetylase [Nocardioides marmoribigeumensis]MDR7361960.1 NAD-dependent deacetylase [Nocardioides marmoribigeumensis]
MDAHLELVDLLATSSRVVGFTGAGVSTESGIPDFRSPGGVWTRYDPRSFELERYVADAGVRRLSWEMRREFFAPEARPNPAHRAFAALEAAGRSPGVITQNIDGLHQDAGSQHVVELHGTAREVRCIGTPRGPVVGGCGWRAPHTWAFERLDAGEDDPSCPGCGQLVKSATVSFGQVLDPEVVDEAVRLVRSADLLLTTGSSLQVHPAAGLPAEARGHGARLVIVNDERTPYDDLADLVVRGRAGEVLGPAVEAVLGR